MNLPRTKVFGVAFDDAGYPTEFIIGLGRSRLGRIVRDGIWFNATIGPATARSFNPAGAAMIAFARFWRS